MFIQMNSQKEKGQDIFLITVFCLIIGVITRIAFCIRYPVQPRDAYTYEQTVREWLNTGEMTEQLTYFPLSLWFFRLSSYFTNYDIFKGGIIFNQVLGLFLIVIAIHVMGRFSKNAYTLCVVGLIVATHPALVRFSCCFLRENTFLLFISMSVYSFACYYQKTNMATLTVASIFGSLAFLCRLEGLEILVVFFFMLFYLLIKKQTSFSKALIHAFSFVLVFIFTIITICISLKLKTPNYIYIEGKLKILPDHIEFQQFF